MRHIDEFTMMLYVDDELSANEREEVAAHLSVCSACQQSHAMWLTDRAWFERSFQEMPPLSPAPLNDLTWAQIEAIASFHKRRSGLASNRPQRLWAAVFAAVLLGALYVLTGANQWLGSLWALWSPGSLFTITFWLKEWGSSLLFFPLRNSIQIAALFAVLFAGLIALNARAEAHRQNGASGGLNQ